jgi:hypothetical protein
MGYKPIEKTEGGGKLKYGLSPLGVGLKKNLQKTLDLRKES